MKTKKVTTAAISKTTPTICFEKATCEHSFVGLIRQRGVRFWTSCCL